MELTPVQKQVVENNMGLVGKVIKDKVHGLGYEGVFTYDDLFQIGCIGLCKAAATDKGGCFSTYAYRLIWNEICDALISATRKKQIEKTLEDANSFAISEDETTSVLSLIEFHDILTQVKSRANGVTSRGIKCLELSAEGYKSREIGKMMAADAATVRMWMTKARRFLMNQPEFQDYLEVNW